MPRKKFVSMEPFKNSAFSLVGELFETKKKTDVIVQFESYNYCQLLQTFLTMSRHHTRCHMG